MKRIFKHPLAYAILVVAGLYLVLAYVVQPPLPRSVLLEYVPIIVIAMLLYVSFDDARWAEFKKPIIAAVHDDNKWPLRVLFVFAVPSLVAFLAYKAVVPSFDPPVELRQVHPAPPSRLKAFNKTYDLLKLENPVRAKVLALLKSDPRKATETYSAAVEAGRTTYYQNCFYCHGDLLNGDGMFADALNPRPANFRDVGTIAQLQESYLFWRITTGGPGLPSEGTPWNSAMPVWGEILHEDDVWNVITFLYDRVGQVPRMWNQQVSAAVSSMRDKIEAKRSNMSGPELYQFHCSACHGEKGAGDGPAAHFLYPAPRDFTSGTFKYRTSPIAATAPTDDDLFSTIKNGLPGTGMPAWGVLLSDDQIRSLIQVVKGFDTVGTWAPKNAANSDFDKAGHYLKKPVSVEGQMPVENQVPFTPESVAKGKVAFEKTCAQCHGADGRGNPNPDKRLKDDWGNRIWPRDLTKPWTWRATVAADSTDKTIRNIYVRLSEGIPGTPMPVHAKKLSEADRWDIANFVYTLRNDTPPPSSIPVILGTKVAGGLPDSVKDKAWGKAQATTLRMIPNVMKEDRLFKPLTDAMSVRVLYNNDEIAFLLEVDDRTDSRPGDADAESTQDKSLDLYSDAFAIQFPKEHSFTISPVVEKPLFRHGDAEHPTTIWYWNAGSVEPKVQPYTMVFDAAGENSKLKPRAGKPGVTATGEWVNGRWRVMLKRRRDGGKSGDLTFADDKFLPVSFADWDGSNGEKGSKHTLSPWYWLLLPQPADPMKIYGTPAAAWIVTFLLGFMLVRREREKTKKGKH